jgi:hypothetical protein
MPKDRSGIIFGPVNADVTIDVPELQIAAEQVRQEAGATGTPIVPATTPTTTINAGFASGYWYQPDGTGSAVLNSFAHGSGYAVPFFVYQPTTIDAIGIVVSDGTAGGVTSPGNYYRTRLGIYDEENGIPTNLIAQTSQFTYGDGTIPNNTFYKNTSMGQVVLSPGRYWLVFRRSSNANLSGPAYVRFRDGAASGTPMKGPFPENRIASGSPYANAEDAIGWAMDFVAGSTGPGVDFTMDPILNFWTYATGPSSAVPDMWLRGA